MLIGRMGFAVMQVPFCSTQCMAHVRATCNIETFEDVNCWKGEILYVYILILYIYYNIYIIL